MRLKTAGQEVTVFQDGGEVTVRKNLEKGQQSRVQGGTLGEKVLSSRAERRLRGNIPQTMELMCGSWQSGSPGLKGHFPDEYGWR